MNLVKLILLGMIRHGLGLLGLWMVEHGWIDQPLVDRLMADGPAQVLGALLIALSILWSVIQKTNFWHWFEEARKAPANTPVAKIAERVNALPRIGTGSLLMLLGICIIAALSMPVAGCATLGKAGPQIAALTEIVNAEQAQKALVMAQEFRAAIRDTTAELYVDGHLSDAQLAKVRDADERFRTLWAQAASIVDLWVAYGALFDRGEFDRTWARLDTVGRELSATVSTQGGGAL